MFNRFLHPDHKSQMHAAGCGTSTSVACTGGGYKKRNVARCWAYETAVLVGQPELVTDQLPSNMYLDNFKNEKEDVTRVPSLNADKMNIYRRGTIPDTYNRPARLDQIRTRALEHLRHVEIAPGIVFNPAAFAVNTAPIAVFAVIGQVADHLESMPSSLMPAPAKMLRINHVCLCILLGLHLGILRLCQQPTLQLCVLA